ncbi:hypothetical protein [Microvirga massiliensis]|uniref:hypothetical protein n=1 Tax=Microvirga massiliensis TaxID=1033741 RepID=UPI00062B5711|nr:hypothetical protein [Microvirga massiliensis]
MVRKSLDELREEMRAVARSDREPSPRPAEPVPDSGLGPLVSLEEGEARLDAITVDDASTDWAVSDLLRASDMAARLQVLPTTLDSWRIANKVIAFPKGDQDFTYPTRQFEQSGPMEGIDRVLAHFPSPGEAWEWLVTPNRYTNDEAPIDRLRARHIDEVARAAEGANDFA